MVETESGGKLAGRFRVKPWITRSIRVFSVRDRLAHEIRVPRPTAICRSKYTWPMPTVQDQIAVIQKAASADARVG